MTEIPTLDIIVAALLVATAGYCFLLARRLRGLKRSQAEMVAAIRAFDAATKRAEKNIERLEKAGALMGRDFDNVLARGSGLLTELSVMVNAGDAVAARLEGAIDDVRDIGARRTVGARQ